jgi:hypothetical protein
MAGQGHLERPHLWPRDVGQHGHDAAAAKGRRELERRRRRGDEAKAGAGADPGHRPRQPVVLDERRHLGPHAGGERRHHLPAADVRPAQDRPVSCGKDGAEAVLALDPCHRSDLLGVGDAPQEVGGAVGLAHDLGPHGSADGGVAGR